MNKKVMMLMILTIFLLALTVNGAENETKWQVFVKKDVMTEEETWYAESPEVSSMEPLGFLYEDTRAILVVGYDGKKEQVFVRFTDDPSLNETKWEGDYKIVDTRIKWDNKIENIRLYIDWKRHDDILLFPNDKDYVSKIINSKTMILELDWFDEGLIHFQFPLEGAAEAINEIHKKFSE